MLRIILLALIGAGSGGVMADSRHNQTIYNTYNNYESETIVNQSNCKDKALSSAQSNNQMAYGVRRPQLSIGGGYCNGDSAISLMLGGRFCDKCSFVNGSIAYDGEEPAVGAAVLILF